MDLGCEKGKLVEIPFLFWIDLNYADMGTGMIILCTRREIAPTLTNLLQEKSLSRHMPPCSTMCILRQIRDHTLTKRYNT